MNTCPSRPESFWASIGGLFHRLPRATGRGGRRPAGRHHRRRAGRPRRPPQAPPLPGPGGPARPHRRRTRAPPPLPLAPRGGFDGRGRAKASWIARAFGIDARAIKAARRELIALGWVAPEPSPQAAENRWGRAYRIDLGWAAPHAPWGTAAPRDVANRHPLSLTRIPPGGDSKPGPRPGRAGWGQRLKNRRGGSPGNPEGPRPTGEGRAAAPAGGSVGFVQWRSWRGWPRRRSGTGRRSLGRPRRWRFARSGRVPGVT